MATTAFALGWLLDAIRRRAPHTMPRLVLLLAVAAKAAALSQKTWLKLPDVDLNPGTFTRRTVASGAAVSAVATPIAASAAQTASRRAGDIQQWPRIPVWPSWAGGRVIPMGLPNADPFLLVAHHKHWFDPRDPLRGPFRAFGKATGLPTLCGNQISRRPPSTRLLSTQALHRCGRVQHAPASRLRHINLRARRLGRI